MKDTREKLILIERFWDDDLDLSELDYLRSALDTDPDFHRLFYESMQMNGLISAAISDDSEYIKLAKVVNSAIGLRDNREFTNFIISETSKISKINQSDTKAHTFEAGYEKVSKKSQITTGKQIDQVKKTSSTIAKFRNRRVGRKTFSLYPQRRESSLSTLLMALASLIILISAIVWLHPRLQNNRQNSNINISNNSKLGPNIFASDGEVIIEREGKSMKITDSVQAHYGDILRVSVNSNAFIKYTDETKIRVFSNSHLKISKNDTGSELLYLFSGRLEAAVKPQTSNRCLACETDIGIFTVIGTNFFLSSDKTKTILSVISGKVAATHKTEKTLKIVGTGQTLTMENNGIMAFAENEPQRLPAENILPQITAFSLIDAENHKPILGFDPIKNNTVIDLAKLPTRKLNILVQTEPEIVGVVKIKIIHPNTDYKLHIEKNVDGYVIEEVFPYTAAGNIIDKQGKVNYFSWIPSPGQHTVIAIPYSDNSMREPGISKTITFNVVDSNLK